LQRNGGLSQVFSSTKIKKATNNFSTVIGVGGFGDVFYGKLPDGQEIAAKVLSTDSNQTKVEFYNEVSALYILECGSHAPLIDDQITMTRTLAL
jgi:hypothetical protein